MDSLEKILNSKQVIPITRSIDLSLYQEVKDKISKNESKNITFCFDTSGGSTLHALWICDLIEVYKAYTGRPVYGFVLCRCHSAGLTILAKCMKRACTPSSRFLFHSGNLTADVKLLHPFNQQLPSLKKRYNQARKTIDVEMEGFGLTKKKYTELCERGDLYEDTLTSEEAKATGIIHEITYKPSFL